MVVGVLCVRYSVAVWDRRVCSQCDGGIVPSGCMLGREREWRDCIRTVVRHVSAHEMPGTRPETGGV